MEIKKFGAIIFDSKTSPTSGWASFGDNGAPIQFIDQTELPSDVLWWSDCPYEAYHEHGRFSSNIRPSSYLCVTPKEIMAEWDINEKNIDPEACARVCGTVFNHAMRIVRGILKLTCPDRDVGSYFSEPTLAADMAGILPPFDYPQDDALEILKPNVAYSNISHTTVPWGPSLETIAVRRPRLDHAIRLLGSPAPVGPFEHIRGADLPPLADLIHLDRPVLAEIVVHRADPRYAPIFGWNVSGSRGVKVQRSWATHPELAALATFADIEIRSAFIGSSYSHLSSQLPEVVRSLIAEGSGSLSWSAGVAVDTLWRSATTGKSIKTGSKYRRAHTTWQGAWLKAYDKVEMFRLAMGLHQSGFRVANYGNGQVRCHMQKERYLELFLTAFQLGMVPAIVEVTQPVSPALLRQRTWGGDAETRGLAWKILTREAGDLWMMNRYPIASREDRAAMVEKVKAC